MEILQRKWIPAMTSNLYLTHINKIAEKKSFVAAAHVNFFNFSTKPETFVKIFVIPLKYREREKCLLLGRDKV